MRASWEICGHAGYPAFIHKQSERYVYHFLFGRLRTPSLVLIWGTHLPQQLLPFFDWAVENTEPSFDLGDPPPSTTDFLIAVENTEPSFDLGDPPPSTTDIYNF